MKIKKINESSLNRVVNGHDKNGYIMISASRHDCLDGIVENPNSEQIIDENNRRTKELRGKLHRLNYSYIPVHGGYQEEGTNKVSLEKSFIVYPYDNVNKEDLDFDTFEQNLIDLGKEYNQETILIKEPEKNPRLYDLINDTWDMEFKNVSFKDVRKEYFTALKNNNGSKYPQRFTYTETYLEESPQTIMGAFGRHSSGELFSMDNYKK